MQESLNCKKEKVIIEHCNLLLVNGGGFLLFTLFILYVFEYWVTAYDRCTKDIRAGAATYSSYLGYAGALARAAGVAGF